MKDQELRNAVRKKYSEIASDDDSCCGSSSCGCESVQSTDIVNTNLGYSEEDLRAVPKGSNLGLGCGNPTALASLKMGETVLDLGSGAGYDCFLAANKVGGSGKVIGVDMTPQMIEKARRNAENSNYRNVEFRLGEIEKLPVADNSVDAVISNCVVNLSTDKQKVFQEVFRVLKPGGRLIVADIVLSKKLPDSIRNDVSAYTCCVSGALLKNDYLEILKHNGFKNIEIMKEFNRHVGNITDDTISITVKGTKPHLNIE